MSSKSSRLPGFWAGRKLRRCGVCRLRPALQAVWVGPDDAGVGGYLPVCITCGKPERAENWQLAALGRHVLELQALGNATGRGSLLEVIPPRRQPVRRTA